MSKPWTFRDGPITWRQYRWGTLGALKWGLFIAPFRARGLALALIAWPKLVVRVLNCRPRGGMND